MWSNSNPGSAWDESLNTSQPILGLRAIMKRAPKSEWQVWGKEQPVSCILVSVVNNLLLDYNPLGLGLRAQGQEPAFRAQLTRGVTLRAEMLPPTGWRVRISR